MDNAKPIVMSFSPSFHRVMQEQSDFETGMLRLAALLPYPVADVTGAFRQWAGPRPLPWRVALDYCIDRARQGKSLPWEVEK